QRYERIFRIQVRPHLGELLLSKLRPLHLQNLYKRLLDEGLSPQTVLHVHRALFTALRQAVKWQLIAINPAEAVTPPRPPRRDVHAITPAEAETLLEAVAGTWLEVPVVLALGTGLRRGEICGLRWSDVDLKAPRLRVMQTIQHIGTELRLLPPKTHRSRRSIALPAFVVETLRRQSLRLEGLRSRAGGAWQNHDLVVCHPDGTPIRPDSLTHAFSRVAKEVGLPLTFHGLRHAHASLMLAGGVHLKVVSDRLGHSTIAITADLYSHVTPALDGEAAAALDELLRPR
ncbi:MAG: tyrosine-type recombinase/integrase, partial [Actinomycetota bacterium]